MVGESDIDFGDLPEDKICGYIPGQIHIPGQIQTAITLVSCHPRMLGRYVRITAAESNSRISIYELEIHGIDL